MRFASVTPLWNVFRGCGHSFHIECIMPKISDCPICEATLLLKVETLGKTANNAVFSPATFVEEPEGGDQGDDENQTDNDEEDPLEDEQNDTKVNTLLERISLWRRSVIPLL